MVILAATISSPPDQENCVGACIISRWPANVPTQRRFAFWHVASEARGPQLQRPRRPSSLPPYLVVSRDELLMVVRLTSGANKLPSAFRVFRALRPVQDAEEVVDEDGEDDQVAEADDQGEEIEYPWSWGELDTLEGRMLFVGRGCSRSYEVAQYPGFEDGIYFSDDRCSYNGEVMFQHRHYPCGDNGRWSEGPPSRAHRCFPVQGPSNYSHPVWLLH
ncbi:hypothetical protein SETIT_3G140300v2 [Setaria italica]|uniref:KIB1-4 beta-propeller domain-containing protein n=1 Tax=Setaria italica TaxID=4555 RepID=K3ZE07_SETIT|nr:hypothetical protein SETIT_3G140300v2 [Setaria italica]